MLYFRISVLAYQPETILEKRADSEEFLCLVWDESYNLDNEYISSRLLLLLLLLLVKYQLDFSYFFPIIPPCLRNTNTSTSSVSEESESRLSLDTITILDIQSRVRMDQILHFSIVFGVSDSRSILDMILRIFLHIRSS